MVEYKLIRTKRKTVAVVITENGTVEVRAPLHLAQKHVERLVAQKEGWITEKQSEAQQKAARRREFTVKPGDTLLYLGKKYPIAVFGGTRALFDGACFWVPQAENFMVKSVLVDLYRTLAKQVVSERIAFFSRQMDVKPSAVKVNGAQKRWGSCSGKNSLNFSWLLVMAPSDAVDYVVVHELAHIKQHNHSQLFWNTVETVLPDYRQREAQLRRLQHKLEEQNWH